MRLWEGVIAAFVRGVIALIVTLIAIFFAIMWVSFTWPWYLYRAGVRVVRPR